MKTSRPLILRNTDTLPRVYTPACTYTYRRLRTQSHTYTLISEVMPAVPDVCVMYANTHMHTRICSLPKTHKQDDTYIRKLNCFVYNLNSFFFFFVLASTCLRLNSNLLLKGAGEEMKRRRKNETREIKVAMRRSSVDA